MSKRYGIAAKIRAFTLLLLVPPHFAPTTFAAEKKQEADLAAYKELSQVRLESTRDLLQKDIQNISIRADAQDKRIDTQNSHIDQSLSLLGSVLAVLGIVIPLAGLAGYFSVARRAKKEAQQEAKATAIQWFQTHENNLQKQLNALETKLQQLEGQAETNFNTHLQRVQIGADEAILVMQQSIREPNIEKTDLTERAEKALSEAATAATNKPESNYTFTDWNNRAFDAFRKGDFDGAIRFWRAATNDKSTTPLLIAQAMLNVGSTLTKLKRFDEAIAVCDDYLAFTDKTHNFESGIATILNIKALCQWSKSHRNESINTLNELINRFSGSDRLSLKEQVGHALFNKSAYLTEIGHFEEAIAICDNIVKRFENEQNVSLMARAASAFVKKIYICGELERFDQARTAYKEVINRFGHSKESEVRREISRAKNGYGYRLLCQAKKNWEEQENSLSQLQQAYTLFTEVTAEDQTSAIALGNKAYCGHLLYFPAEDILDALTQALELGGEPLYQGTLEDLQIYPVPERDDSFRVILDELWGRLNPPPDTER